MYGNVCISDRQTVSYQHILEMRLCCFILAWNLARNIKGRAQADSIREEGAKEA